MYSQKEWLEDNGYVHIDDLPDLQSISDFMEGVIHAFYISGDPDEMENCVDELAGLLNLHMPTCKPKMGPSSDLAAFLLMQREMIKRLRS